MNNLNWYLSASDYDKLIRDDDEYIKSIDNVYSLTKYDLKRLKLSSLNWLHPNDMLEWNVNVEYDSGDFQIEFPLYIKFDDDIVTNIGSFILNRRMLNEYGINGEDLWTIDYWVNDNNVRSLITDKQLHHKKVTEYCKFRSTLHIKLTLDTNTNILSFSINDKIVYIKQLNIQPYEYLFKPGIVTHHDNLRIKLT